MTKEEQVKSTKQKILEVSSKLFAVNGFNGTSVRDIAKEAGVNLAAVNYHFKNKHNLYWKVMENSHLVMSQKITQLGENTKTTEELTIEVFNFFISSESEILNTFRMFLSSNVEVSTESIDFDEKGRMGPPGEAVFLEKLNLDLDVDVSEQAKEWAVKMIFSLIIHFGVVSSAGILKINCDKRLKPEALKHSLREAVKAFIAHAKTNPSF